VQGLGIAWPGNDLAILGLIGWYVLTAAAYVAMLRSGLAKKVQR
jgi:uncharacterized membrane protein